MAEYFIIEHIALLGGVEYLAFELGSRSGYCCDSLVELGVEVGAGALHGLHALTFEVFYEFLIYQFHALAHSLGVLGLFGGGKTALEVIDDGQQA